MSIQASVNQKAHPDDLKETEWSAMSKSTNA